MLRKIAVDNSVKYVSKDDHSHTEQAPPIPKEIYSKPNTRKKNASNINGLSKKSKNFF